MLKSKTIDRVAAAGITLAAALQKAGEGGGAGDLSRRRQPAPVYGRPLLRAESVEGQLDGTIPSTEEGQLADSSALIDASSIDLSVMGSMMGGGGGQMEERQPGNEPGAAPAENGKAEEETDSAGEDALPTAFTAESVSTMPLSAAASEPAESAPSDAAGEQTPPDNAGTTPEDAGTAASPKAAAAVRMPAVRLSCKTPSGTADVCCCWSSPF